MIQLPLALVCGYMAWKYMSTTGDMTEIMVEGRTYKVRDYDDKRISQGVAEDLHELTLKVEKLLNHLEKKYPANGKVQKLLDSYNGNIQEITFENEGQVGYNVNKGEAIGLCMYKNGKFMDINTIMFVLLHELAHSMTVAYSHDKEFWDNFSFLLNESMRIGIYTYEDFKSEPKTHCNMKIGHTPV